MSKKLDLEKIIKNVKQLVSNKKKEVLDKRKDLKYTEAELANLVSLESELEETNRQLKKFVKMTKFNQKDLTELISAASNNQ